MQHYATLFVLYKNVMAIVRITLNCSKSHNIIRVPFTLLQPYQPLMNC